MEKDKRIDLGDVREHLASMTFDSKMMWAYRQSLSIMNPFSHEINNITPDVIETFVMLSINSGEMCCKDMTLNEYEKIIRDISSFHHPEFNKMPIEERIKWYFLTIVPSQVVHQMNPFYLIKRYMFYFSHMKNIDMKAEFMNKFGVNYKDVIGPVSLLWIALIPDSIIEMSIEGYHWMYKKYKKTFDLLTISREIYNQQLEQITNNTNDYRFCLRPSFQKPFISIDGKCYLPTPHLLIISATSSLMFRLTEGNIRLREKIGKYVLESYLYKIIKESKEFNEVIPERTYGNNQKTLDVMSRISEDIILFDSKSFSPSIGVKVFSNEAFGHIRDVLSDDICQAYRHIHDKYGSEYSYLSVPVKEDKSNIYAVIVIAEEPYMVREEVYLESAKK